jgi:uncharacterized protein
MISPFLSGAARILAPLLIAGSLALPFTAHSEEDAASKAAKAERLAFRYLEGDGRKADVDKAIQWFEKAAAAGRPIAQVSLAEIYMWNKERHDPKRAAEFYRAAAQQGVGSAQGILGWLYLAGTSVPQDYEQALKWLTAATRQGDAYGTYMLGLMYHRGEGVPANEDVGRRLVRRAAELGLVSAWNDVGAMMLGGPADRRDPKLGLHYLVKAANANDADSQLLLAKLYVAGSYVPKNLTQSAHYLKLAADRKLTLATLFLSEFHAKGLGVERNPQLAKKMLSDALRTATLSDRNEFAWMLSVSPVQELRNGELAIQVLAPALAKEAKKPAAYIDTLAAAFAETGDFDRAVAFQIEAIEAVPPMATEMQADLKSRLELYKSHKAYREPAQ